VLRKLDSYAQGQRRSRGNEKWGAGWIGRALAVLKPRSGSSLPRWAGRRRRATNSRATRRLDFEPVGH